MTEVRDVVRLNPLAVEPAPRRWQILIRPATEPPVPHLTERQLQVLHGLDRGLCDKEIAQDLEIAVSTVKSHTRAIYEKLEVRSRTAAVHAARERRMI